MSGDTAAEPLMQTSTLSKPSVSRIFRNTSRSASDHCHRTQGAIGFRRSYAAVRSAPISSAQSRIMRRGPLTLSIFSRIPA